MLEGRKSGGGCEQFPASACPRHQHLQSAHFCALQNLLQVTGGIPAFCSLSFPFLIWMWLDSEIREPRFSLQSGGCQQVEVGRNLSLALIGDAQSRMGNLCLAVLHKSSTAVLAVRITALDAGMFRTSLFPA